MCETWNWKNNRCEELVPANTNFRHYANKIWDNSEVKKEEVWYGIEQEYTLLT